jgi:hypothetical protein
MSIFDGVNAAVIEAFGESVHYGAATVQGVVTDEPREELIAGVPTQGYATVLHLRAEDWAALGITGRKVVTIATREYVTLQAVPDRAGMVHVELRGK